MKYFFCLLVFILLFLCACRNTPALHPPVNNPPFKDTQKEPEQVDEKEETVEYKSEYEKIEALSKKDSRYLWIKHFLDRDSEACANFLRASDSKTWDEREVQYDKWFAHLKTLTFGKYFVKEEILRNEYTEYKVLLFEFEIVESSSEMFPVGTYTYVVGDGSITPAYWHKKESLEIQNEDAATLFNFVSSHIYSAAAIEEQTPSAKTVMFDTVECFHREIGGEIGEITKEELQRGVLEIFGVKNFVPNDYTATLTDGVYHAIGHGGFSSSHEILEVKESQNEVAVTVQFYADIMNLSKSHLMRYTIELTDGDYPVRLASVEQLEEGVWDPYVWMA